MVYDMMKSPSKVDGNTAYRIGIDVGGTFTKAVMVDAATRQIVGRASVHTTHSHERGVAAGVIDVFRDILDTTGASPEQIVFLAHSTTQATNALLEGDVSPVGLVGLADREAEGLAQQHLDFEGIELAPGKTLPVRSRFLSTEGLQRASADDAVRSLRQDGAKVLVASAAFGVDDTTAEELVRSAGTDAGIPTTCGHDVSRLYGLKTRTRTALVNASILPKMIATAEMTELCVREAGIGAPLMIMRGDGGVMDIAEVRRRPALTLLSGPAASVAGALMHVRMSDGIYFEVGGTSTNIGVIKNGRPAVKFAKVGGHETYIRALDVRVLGVAGGSLVRVLGKRIVDVGPRSAHIAGLRYAAFADPGEFDRAELVLVEPRPGDTRDHVAIRGRSGELFALTPTCAANALKLTDPLMHCYALPHAALFAFACLGEHLGLSAEAAAQEVLDVSSGKIAPSIESLIREYKLDPEQRMLIGEGGGAGALIRHLSNRLGVTYQIAKDAEVISSIGAALAMVREVVERIIPNPTADDLAAIRKEAVEAVLAVGAVPGAVEVTIEIDKVTSRVSAIAVGTADLVSDVRQTAIGEDEAAHIAAGSLGQPKADVLTLATLPGFWIFGGKDASALRVVDVTGTIRIQRSGGRVVRGRALEASRIVRELHTQLASPDDASHTFGGAFLLFDRHLLDLTGVEEIEQALSLVESETVGLDADTPIVLLGFPTHAAVFAEDNHEP